MSTPSTNTGILKGTPNKNNDTGDVEHQLAIQYFYGKNDKKQDHEQAAILFEQAANKEHGPAQFAFGYCLLNGVGIIKDEKRAIEFLTKASNQNNGNAHCLLGRCYFEGKISINVIKQDKKLAIELFHQAAQQDIVEAVCNLGICYFDGDGVAKDKKRGLDFLQKAADKNNTLAKEMLDESDTQFELGCCYEQGKDGIPKDMSKALEWYKKAANQGLDPAIAAMLRLDQELHPNTDTYDSSDDESDSPPLVPEAAASVSASKYRM